MPEGTSDDDLRAAVRIFSRRLPASVVGLDLLDRFHIGPTLTYISEFKSEVKRLETIMPTQGLEDAFLELVREEAASAPLSSDLGLAARRAR